MEKVKGHGRKGMGSTFRHRALDTLNDYFMPLQPITAMGPVVAVGNNGIKPRMSTVWLSFLFSVLVGEGKRRWNERDGLGLPIAMS